MATSSKSSSKPKMAAKAPLKKLSIAEQKAKLAIAKAKFAAPEA